MRTSYQSLNPHSILRDLIPSLVKYRLEPLFIFSPVFEALSTSPERSKTFKVRKKESIHPHFLGHFARMYGWSARSHFFTSEIFPSNSRYPALAFFLHNISCHEKKGFDAQRHKGDFEKFYSDRKDDGTLAHVYPFGKESIRHLFLS